MLDFQPPVTKSARGSEQQWALISRAMALALSQCRNKVILAVLRAAEAF
jgi:hypothetical protein